MQQSDFPVAESSSLLGLCPCIPDACVCVSLPPPWYLRLATVAMSLQNRGDQQQIV